MESHKQHKANRESYRAIGNRALSSTEIQNAKSAWSRQSAWLSSAKSHKWVEFHFTRTIIIIVIQLGCFFSHSHVTPGVNGSPHLQSLSLVYALYCFCSVKWVEKTKFISLILNENFIFSLCEIYWEFVTKTLLFDSSLRKSLTILQMHTRMHSNICSRLTALNSSSITLFLEN